jgi:ParB family chromosome partitioning protein
MKNKAGDGETSPAETLTIAGAVIGLNHDGSVRIERGLVRKGDEQKARRLAEADSGDAGRAPASLPASLVVDLTAQKSAAIGVELIRQPDIALVVRSRSRRSIR